jgi:hypothetical protein
MALNHDSALTAREMLACITRGDARWDLYPAERKRRQIRSKGKNQ